MADFNFDLQRFVSVLEGTSDDDYLYNRRYYAYDRVRGYGGRDTIINKEVDYVSLDGGSGDDTIRNYSSYDVKIYGGSGDDYVYSESSRYVYVNTEEGDDDIYSKGDTYVEIYGNEGADVIEVNSNYGTIHSGDGADSVYIYESSSNIWLDGGRDNDYVRIYDGAQNVTVEGSLGSNRISLGSAREYVMYGGYGNDTVSTFTSGMASNSDVIVLYNGFSTATRSGYDVFFTASNGNQMRLVTNTNSSDDAILYSGDGSTFYSAKIADSTATEITYYNGIKYYGLSQFGTLNILNDYLNHSVWLDGSDGVSYLYIANINAASSSGNDYLAGNSGNNYIRAGSGESTLWGGNGGNDTLVGGSAKDYFRFTGAGNDVVVDFTSGMASNSDAAILPENFTVSRSNNILTFRAQNGYTMTVNTNSYSGDDAILYSGDGSTFYSAKIADSSATNITYYENIKYYGLAQFGTLNLQNGTHDANSHDIRLDGSNGVSYLYIANINASGSSGNDTLIGNSGNNEIRAGSGNSTLWGGQYDGTADNLIGGDGVDMFLVGKNDGNDVINNSSYNDVISLYDVSLSEITSTAMTSTGFTLSLNSGSNITVNNTDNLSCAVWTSDGGRYRYNRSSGQWQGA